MIFQNPTSHLDPLMTIGNQIAESLRVHDGLPAREALGQAAELLRQWAFPTRAPASTTTRTSFPAACASGR